MGVAKAAREAEFHTARGPRGLVLWAIALAGFAAAGTSFALALNSDHVNEPGLQAALMDWITLPYIVAGLIAWRRRPESRFGPLMIVAGFAMFMSTLAWANAPLPFTIGQLFDLLPAVLFLHIFLAFPTGRLQHKLDRVLVGVGYFTAFGLEVVGMLLGGFGPDNLLEVVSEPAAAHTLQQVQLVVISALCLTGVGLLFARRRRNRRLRRPVALLIDAFALGLVMIAVLFVTGAFEGPHFETIRRATFFVIGLAPAAFLVGLLSSRLARSAVADLLVELHNDPPPSELRAALARALRDPSLTLAYWLPEYESWADLDGRRVVLSELAGSQATTLIDRNGRHVAALLHDPALDDEPELLDAVVAAAAIALENARLHAELRARLDELRGSRARLVEAGDTERRRLERNLHDGAQQRLVSLSLELGLVARRLAPGSDEEQLLTAARDELAASLKELRELAQGIHPAVLSDHGLTVALESLATRSPVPVALHVAVDRRLAPPVEVAAYYLVSEALTNVAKYARASSATVDVERENGTLVVVIADDGVGGADPDGGSGLRGLADRVEALDGQLCVSSRPAQGTTVRAEIPCA